LPKSTFKFLTAPQFARASSTLQLLLLLLPLPVSAFLLAAAGYSFQSISTLRTLRMLVKLATALKLQVSRFPAPVSFPLALFDSSAGASFELSFALAKKCRAEGFTHHSDDVVLACRDSSECCDIPVTSHHRRLHSPLQFELVGWCAAKLVNCST
jgi:hypothetical protein